jgi:predicted phosphodiesterase
MKQKVRDFLNAGWSRRKIAAELGCTEYRVRAIKRSLVIDKLRKDETDTFEGRLRLSKVFSKKERTKITAVMNDIHIPYHDQRALAIALEYLRDIEPDTIILNGDIVDFYSVSRFQKDPMRIDTLQSELDETRAFLTLLRREHPRATIIYTKGNHEDRLERFLIDRASALMSLRCLSLDDLLGLSENKVKFVDTSVQVGKLEVTHGTLARNIPGSSVRGHFERTHASVLIGHVHRLNVQQFRNLYGTHTLIENGCLCGLQPEYAARMTNWQQGFSVIEHSPKTGDFEVHMRSIVDGAMSVGDRVYRTD